MEEQLQPHIRCKREDAAKYAILPGDPQRVEKVKGFLEQPKEIAYNREFRTVTGYYKGIKVMVTSTGIGGPSAGIAVEELKNIGVENLFRIGSCGALQEQIKLGELIIANAAVRCDGASDAYIGKEYPAVPDTELLLALIRSARAQNYTYHCGKVRSHDSFYTDREAEIDQYWSKKGILGSDMESSALFVIGGLRGLRTASVLNVVVEAAGELETGINEYVDGKGEILKGEEREILTVLEAIVLLENSI